jgi:hypothetical protein
MGETAHVLQDFEAVDLGKIEIDDDEIGQARTIHVGYPPDGLFAIVGALKLGCKFLRTNGFPDKEDVGIVVFDDENLSGAAGICHRTRFFYTRSRCGNRDNSIITPLDNSFQSCATSMRERG